MSLKFYNTRTNRLEQFQPDDDVIGIYTCGPTVYDRVHIGNLRTFFWSDFIVSVLKHLYGDRVKAIMNITDIDDKILKRLPRQDLSSLLEYTGHYTEAFLSDMKQLGIQNYNHDNIYRVTDTIPEIESIINGLLEKESAYRTEDGNIYFDSSRVDKYPFPTCQKPALDAESDRSIIRSEDVRDPRDFVLWKVKDNEYIQWNSERLGSGRPGWHIECSAIASRNLPNVTLHMGGEDLKFPHHTCEILQSESYDSRIFGKYWIHMGFLNMSGEKMSKSIGNLVRMDELENVNKRLLRWYLFTKHYRKTFDFSLEELEGYYPVFRNFHLMYNRLRFGVVNPVEDTSHDNINFTERMIIYILNDFDTPRVMKELQKWLNYWTTTPMSSLTIMNLIEEMNQINRLLNVMDWNLLNIDEDAFFFIQQREQCKLQKDFDKADQIRTQLSDRYWIEDYNNGFSVVKLSS